MPLLLQKLHKNKSLTLTVKVYREETRIDNPMSPIYMNLYNKRVAA